MKTLMETFMTGNKSRILWYAAKLLLKEHMNPGIDKAPAQGVHEPSHEGFMINRTGRWASLRSRRAGRVTTSDTSCSEGS
jgi:hypothetical protein